MKKRILTILLSVTLILSMMPLQSVMAVNSNYIVSYCDENGKTAKCDDYEVIDNNHTTFNADKDMWLVFDGETVNLPRITLAGWHTFHLIIKDGQDITVNGGIFIKNGSLVIYGQKEMTGRLKALGDSDAAGIGGNYVTSIVINGADIFARGEEGAGIGTANGYHMISECENITINGGNVHAISENGGAGVGTGGTDRFYTACGDININGGNVYAEAKNGAGIGTGVAAKNETHCGNIHITGGTITAKSSEYGAGIGTGYGGSNDNRCGDITIDSGAITAESVNGAGIGLGWSYRVAYVGNITINGGNVIAKSEEGQAVGKARFDSEWIIGDRSVASGMTVNSGDSEETAQNVATLKEATGKYAHIYRLLDVGASKIKLQGTSITKIVKGNGSFNVKWKKQSTIINGARITGYQVQYATNKKFTQGKKTITVKGYSKTNKKIKKTKCNKTYYVRVRTYQLIKEDKLYSNWSKVKKV